MQKSLNTLFLGALVLCGCQNGAEAYPPQPREATQQAAPINYSKDLNPLTGSGLDGLDIHYKIEITDVPGNLYQPILILRTSKGECNDEVTPEVITFTSYGIFQLQNIEPFTHPARRETLLFTQNDDALLHVGSTEGLCSQSSLADCQLEAELNGRNLSLRLSGRTSAHAEALSVWQQDFRIHLNGIPFRGLRPAGDRTFCR